MPDLSIIRHKRERQFAEAFFDHDDWEYQPGPYLLSTGSKYTPDFLDKRRNCLIEVVGTKQAYSNNRFKYEFAIKQHGMELEFRLPNGDIMEISKTKYLTSGDRYVGSCIPCIPTMEQIRNEILFTINSLGWSVNKFSKVTGVPQATLSRFISNDNTIWLSYPNVEKIWPYIYGEQRPYSHAQDQ